MSDDLVERVARAMAVGDSFDPDLIINNDTPDCPQPLWGLYRHSARAAIAACMEEAAKVAENASFHFTQTTPSTVEVVDVRHTIAAAIRALVKEPA